MKKEKKNNGVYIAIIVLLLLTISLGYALISKNYNFNGVANIKGNSWGVVPPGEGEIEVEPSDTPDDEKPKVEIDDETGDVTISYIANLDKPGDYYTFTLPIKNTGSIDAVVDSVLTTPLSEEHQKYMIYTITAADGSDLVGKNLVAETGELKVKLTIKYRDDNQKELPTTDVSGIQLKTILKLVQKKS